MSRSTFLLIMSSVLSIFSNSISAMRTNQHFSRDMDNIIKEIVRDNPKLSWKEKAKAVSEEIGFEITGKQCKERFESYSISNSPWTAEEDRLILESLNQIGKNWVKINGIINGSLHTHRNIVKLKGRYIVLKKKANQYSISIDTKDGINQFIKILNGKTETATPALAKTDQSDENLFDVFYDF